MSANPALFINFSTKASRSLVRQVLQPHSEFGLRTQDIFKSIHEKFPDAKEDPKYVPDVDLELTKTLRNQQRYPEFPKHPVRSMKHLKSNILPDMVQSGEVQEVTLAPSSSSSSSSPSGETQTLVKYKYLPPLKKVQETIPHCILPPNVKMEWRWRLVPEYIFNQAEEDERQDLDWDRVRKIREGENRVRMERERHRQLRKQERKRRERGGTGIRMGRNGRKS
ncbi:hypothetical protein K435DRAFT_868536 [Dendrothele bispora CBS 962.96]|uniref:Uncharacterized protein n=1 Tax=Dendrothele bispora (strain CBS 962.96) TaxID=1314807 RepID=A0A4S8KX05_DENBC|nr:hypothetical protein K435DRAFT_874760 [Dendrothele bispora CBS 962.96]THU86167.1 hypothetical protein K435DRAFT_868536 [Dendrothele bispora CBS 962.96]